jgi:ABC-type multidrug transport system, ATPase component
MSISGEPVIEVSGLSKEYGSVTAVDNVSFEIQSGEIFALVGPNGAGKTTTVEILECLRTPTDGTVRILGHSVADESREVKRHIGVVPQSFETFGRLTVAENVGLIQGLYNEGRSVEDVLAELGLADWADTRFSALSGGLRRRTGIAMAMISDPDLLFLDEPTTGLDPNARRQTWKQIEQLSDRGTTIILTTHYMEEVEQLADRTALMIDGRLEAVDTVDALIEEYGGVVRLTVEMNGGSTDIEATLREETDNVFRTDGGDIVGVFDDRKTAQEMFGQLTRLDGERSIELTSTGMEEVFMHLAGGSVSSEGVLV